ncbi:3-keto-disaccharide hydrolase [Maribacter sp. 2-571]|uniref:3-keto-disaccharide hydrolase n=1 Tax=Maribacter sp. 2-571 TaxID=3417569 RepID=UPI003D3505BA
MKKQKHYVKFVSLFALLFAMGCTETPKDTTPWVALFNGKDLEGWSQKGGTATYSIRDGAIVGTTVDNTPNSFMTSDKMYGDFILELEYLVDATMNSGIQIRSNSFPYYQDGRVHGYQIEIDPSDRAWSAGIYEEGARGWLYPLENNTAAQKAFKQNEWNHYRIEAFGDTLKTWINGTPAAHLIDEQTARGFIGLQVHSIYGDQKAGTEIQWKNIRIITDSVAKYVKKTSVPPLVTKNKLTKKEREEGWEMLWDGATSDGWRGARLERFPEEGWVIRDGVLSVLATGGEESTAGGDIVTVKRYAGFELKVDFKLTETANSGIKYYVDTELNKGPGSSIGLEYQILDDARHPDAKLGSHAGSRTLASLYDLIEADAAKPAKPIGEWNTAHIVSKANHVEHWLNGVKVLEYERKSDAFRKLVAESKYKVWPNFGEGEDGQILLQDHGDLVHFKNIKIKSIAKE